MFHFEKYFSYEFYNSVRSLSCSLQFSRVANLFVLFFEKVSGETTEFKFCFLQPKCDNNYFKSI